MPSLRFIIGSALAAALVIPSVAAACSAVGLIPFEPDASLSDDTPPSAIGEVEVSISRGKAPMCRFGSCSSTSCDDIGFLTLDFDPATDDQTEVDRMAFEIEVVDGEPIPGLPEGPFRTGRGDNIPLQWGDGATDDQEVIDFSIVVRAVDEAGNVGPASEEIEIFDSGSASGCSIGGRGNAAPLLLLPVLAWAGRRRRSASRS